MPASAHSGHPQLRASLLKGGQSACCSAELFSDAARFHLAVRMLGRGGVVCWKTVFSLLQQESTLTPWEPLRAASRGPHCGISTPSFNLETSHFLQRSSGSGGARSSSAAPLLSGHGGGCRDVRRQASHSRDSLPLPSLVTLDKSLSFPDF